MEMISLLSEHDLFMEATGLLVSERECVIPEFSCTIRLNTLPIFEHDPAASSP